MQHRDWKLRIKDILNAAKEIKSYAKSVSFEDFVDDSWSVSAVLHNLAVIGEAARHVPKEVQNRYPNIPWNEMRDMRNIVVHEYFGVDLPIIWHTIQSDIPEILLLLEDFLAKINK